MLTKFIKTTINHLTYHYCQLYRHQADKEISTLFGKIKNGNRKILIEALWDNPHHWVRLGLFTKALRNVKLGDELIAICENYKNKKILNTLRSLPITTIKYLEEVSLSKREFKKIDDIIKKYNSGTSIFSINFPMDYPAILFHDGLNKINFTGKFTHETSIVFEALKNLFSYLKYFKKILEDEKPTCVVVSHPTQIIYSSLVWVSIKKNIPVYVLNYEHQHMTIRKENLKSFLRYHQGLPDKKFLDKIPNKIKNNFISIGKDYLSQLESGKGGQFSVVKVFGKGVPTFKNKKEFVMSCNGKIGNPCVIILCSCFPDFPNTYGKSWYNDYVSWLRTTLKTASLNPNINWIVKAHPAEHMYGNKIKSSMIISEFDDCILTFPKKGNALDVQRFADYIITPNGTAGLEHTAKGKIVLISRTNPYTNCGIGYSSKNKSEYVHNLKNIKSFEKPLKKDINNSLIYLGLTYAYYKSKKMPTLVFDFGILSYKLWPKIKSFLKKQQNEINNEIKIIENWLSSSDYCYHSYKQIYLIKRDKNIK